MLAPGHLLGGAFEIEGVAGEGGMAVVYRAVQKSLGRPVAIKVLHSRFASDPQFISRFEAESGALASLTHPNIVTIFDRGHHGNHYYFVMELVDGDTLDLRIVNDTISRESWRGIITACGEALDYVHRRGVVHRDIKASNILIDREGRVKLGDFGIAHIVGGDEGEAAQITAPRKAVGTASYMAPEQTADPSNVDSRADIYSLGVTFYKMMTRRLPVGAYSPPSELNSAVPVAADSVLFRAMCPDRDERYQNVLDFTNDLLAALKKESVSMASAFSTRRPPSASSALYSGNDFRRHRTPNDVTPQEARPEPPAPRQPSDTSTSGVLSKSELLRISGAFAKPADPPPGPAKAEADEDSGKIRSGIGAALRRLWRSSDSSR